MYLSFLSAFLIGAWMMEDHDFCSFVKWAFFATVLILLPTLIGCLFFASSQEAGCFGLTCAGAWDCYMIYLLAQHKLDGRRTEKAKQARIATAIKEATTRGDNVNWTAFYLSERHLAEAKQIIAGTRKPAKLGQVSVVRVPSIPASVS